MKFDGGFYIKAGQLGGCSSNTYLLCTVKFWGSKMEPTF